MKNDRYRIAHETYCIEIYYIDKCFDLYQTARLLPSAHLDIIFLHNITIFIFNNRDVSFHLEFSHLSQNSDIKIILISRRTTESMINWYIVHLIYYITASLLYKYIFPSWSPFYIFSSQK